MLCGNSGVISEVVVVVVHAVVGRLPDHERHIVSIDWDCLAIRVVAIPERVVRIQLEPFPRFVRGTVVQHEVHLPGFEPADFLFHVTKAGNRTGSAKCGGTTDDAEASEHPSSR